jgi:voltage-gated potassium channel
MTRKRYEELTRAGRHRVVAGVLLRAAAAVALLVVGYYLAPLDRPLDTGTLIEFLLALAVVGAVIAWEVRNILISDVPRLRAVQTVAVGVPMLLLVFASVYVQIETSQPNSFSETLSRTDALYFAVTVFSTVGFGDIVPKSELARIVTMSQMLTGLIVLGLVAKVVFGAVQTAVARREGAAAVRPTAPGRDDTQQPDARADRSPTRGG